MTKVPNLLPHVHGIFWGGIRAHLSSHGGCGDRPIHRKTAQVRNRRSQMSKSRSLGAAVAFAMLTTAALTATPANAAVVTCKTAGVPQGCVARPTPVVVAPVVRPIAPVYRAAVIAPIAPVYRAAVVAPGATIGHVGYTRITPYGVRHAGYTRVWR
jgi:hypothetical protein